MRTAFFSAFIVLTVVGFLMYLGQIGKPRKPVTARDAGYQFVSSLAIVAIVWFLWAS